MSATIEVENDKAFEESARQHVVNWFALCDRLLDSHRKNFVVGNPSQEEINVHKKNLSRFIRYCHGLSVALSDPESGDSGLAARLQVRIKQLELAFGLVDDSILSEEQAEKLLNEVFPS